MLRFKDGNCFTVIHVLILKVHSELAANNGGISQFFIQFYGKSLILSGKSVDIKIFMSVILIRE